MMLVYGISFIVLAFKMEIYLQKSFQIIMQALTKKRKILYLVL